MVDNAEAGMVVCSGGELLGGIIMRKGLGLATVSVVLLLQGASTPAGIGASSVSTTAAASVSCGTEHTKGMGALKLIASGTSCATAHKVMRDFAAKGVFWHFVGTNHVNGYSPVEYRPGLWAAIPEYVGMTCTEARNFVVAIANPPHRVSPGFVCHDLHAQGGGGAEECVSGSRSIKIEFA
jgi:hypothetical protein